MVLTVADAVMIFGCWRIMPAMISTRALCATVEATGRKFTYHQVDVSDRKHCVIFINTVKAVNKKIDILVNNAGITMRKPAAEHPDEYWDKVIDKKNK